MFDCSNLKSQIVSPAHGLLWENISCTPAEEALLQKIYFELVSKEQRVGAVFVFQKKSEVLNDNIGVIVCLQEPVSFVLKAILRDMVVSILEMFLLLQI